MALTQWSPNFYSLLFLSAILVFSWLILQFVYNVHFHPLAHIPGPFFGRRSPWPSAMHAWKGDRHLWLERCFKEYGNVLRVAPNTVLFRNPAAYRDIYGSRANVRRADFYDGLRRSDTETSTLTYTDNAMHARSRRMLDLAFTSSSLRSSADFMQQHLNRWHELLTADSGDDWTQPLNLTNRLNYLVLDILCDVCFGASLRIMEPGDSPLKAVPRAVVKTATLFNAVARTPLLGLLSYLRSRGLSRVFKAIRPAQVVLFDEFVEKSIAQRVEREKEAERWGEPRKDMFHFIYNARDDKTGGAAFRDGNLTAECRLLVAAGSDSTSVTLSGLFFYLSHYGEALGKLRQEITSTFVSPEDILPGPGLSSCKYLKAAIDEAMRMTPAGLSELPRHVLPEGTYINGDYFPENTVVGTAAWCDGYNEEIYGDAAIYRPERWLVDDGNSAQDVARIRANFHPFSIGPHNCVGMNFALQELMLVVAKTVHRFEFRLAPEWERGEGRRHRRAYDGRDVPHFQLRDAFITVRDGPVLQFRKRA